MCSGRDMVYKVAMVSLTSVRKFSGHQEIAVTGFGG